MRHRLLWRLYAAFLAVVFLSLVVVGFHAAHSIGAIHRASLRTELEARARMLARMAAPVLSDSAYENIERICRELGGQTNTRLTVILLNGRVIGDTREDPHQMDRHHTRPEIAAALAGRVGENTRLSATVGEPMLYVATPIRRGNTVIGAARASVPLAAIHEQQASLRRRLLAAGFAAAGLAAVLAFILSKWITLPIERMRRVAEQYAEGDLSARMAVEGPEEIARLGEVLNRMGSDLQNRIDTVIEQRNEQEAVLTAMNEGVFTVLPDGRIRDCNASAAQLLHTTSAKARGRLLAEVARNSTLQNLVRRTSNQGVPGECDLFFRVPKERFVQAHAVPLPRGDTLRLPSGSLVVLTDVTRLKHLETMRRDFVANVSHELKTPITSIRAACETLMDETERCPDDTHRFLDIIHRHAGRLESIVDDLLTLSRIEYTTEHDESPRVIHPVPPVLKAAMKTCQPKAEKRKVRLILSCEGHPTALIRPSLLEQAVINLVDNAVKFSPPGGEVRIECEATDKRLSLRISDQGPGIEPEHQSRIFERFYCVDPGRSRKLGGTGLGLAIVKHIALTHGGAVRVESRPAQGSTFVFEIPSVPNPGTGEPEKRAATH